jgi:hypothetical protein
MNPLATSARLLQGRRVRGFICPELRSPLREALVASFFLGPEENR